MTVKLYENLTVYNTSEFSSAPGAAAAPLKSANDGGITLDHAHITNNAAAGSLTADAAITGTQLISTVAIGTAPLTVTSTTKVANLNADRLDDKDTTTSGAASSVVATDASGNVGYSGALVANKNTTTYSGYAFVPLTAQLTSTSWNGDSYSTTSKTLIDLSAEFSAPAGIKAVLIAVGIRDSGSAATEGMLILSPNNNANEGDVIRCKGLPNDFWMNQTVVVPCNADGDIYYQIAASGSATLDVYLQIWGYWI